MGDFCGGKKESYWANGFVVFGSEFFFLIFGFLNMLIVRNSKVLLLRVDRLMAFFLCFMLVTMEDFVLKNNRGLRIKCGQLARNFG